MSKKDSDAVADLAREIGEMFTSDPGTLQKKYIDEAYQKYDSMIEPFRYLWKLADKAWLSNRESLWTSIVDRERLDGADTFLKSYWQQLGRFYIKAKPRKSDDRLYGYIWLALTPFENPDELAAHFELQRPSIKREIHRDLLGYASYIYRAVPQEFHRVELIAQALYNEKHFGNTEPQGYEQKNELVVIEPSDFVLQFMGETRSHLKRAEKSHLKLGKDRGQHYSGEERSFVEVSVDYFIRAFEDVMERRENKIGGRLLERVQKGLNSIEDYKPDVDNKFKDAFVAESHEKILKNDLIIELRAKAD